MKSNLPNATSRDLRLRAASGRLVRSASFVLLIACALFASTKGAVASEPILNTIMPRGVRAGGEYELTFSGARLGDAEEVFFYDQGVSALAIEKIDGNNIKVKIKVEAGCRVGEHVAQVRTKNGISDFRSFFVGRLPEVAEVEPNSDLSEAQAIDLNVTVTGVVTNEDIDYFKINGKKGDRVSVEVEAIRLGFLFDPAIALLDKDRFEIAVSDDTPLTKQDCYFSVLLPEDGEYFVALREASFVGNPQSNYRLHVGNFPRPAAVYPAGGKPNESIEVDFIDAVVGNEAVRTQKQTLQLPAEEGFRGGVFCQDESGFSPTPMPFRISTLENLLEVEPNNGFNSEQAVTLPHAFNGIISEPGDIDYFRFSAKKGQVWDVECFARRIGSGLDAVMNIFDANKKHLVGNDDTRKSDSYIRFTVPEDGDYFVRIYDHLRRGQPDFVYRLELTQPKPKLALGINRIDRYSQRRQAIAVPQGNRFAVLVNATRTDFGGEISLLGDNLPAGIRMIAPPMRPNLNLMPVVFEVDPDTPLAGGLIDFRGTAKLNEQTTIEGGFQNLADFVLGQPNNSLYYSCTVDKLAFAVVEKLPFKLELVQPKAPLVRNGKIALKIIAHRDEGFDAPINLQFPFRTPGVGTTYQIQMPKGQSEAYYPLNANGNAEIGKFPMYVIGNSNFKGPAWASTQMAELEVAGPFVTAELPRVSFEQGQSSPLVCKLNQLQPFEGEATAEIVGIPANITIDTPKKFTKETTELVFNIETNEQSPVGKHGGMFCQITVMVDGEPVVARAGNAVVQINKPKPPADPITPPAAASSASSNAVSPQAESSQQ